ncbi:MAG: aldo/keto reductase [Nitrospiraceae bacterium]|nr:MAG: aldo/keto reductase [Nitrospiraceae bacterium]
MKRRDFLKASVAATAALASHPIHAEAEPITAKSEKAAVKTYTEIGKTGLKMSDISFGTGSLSSPSMILRAVDRGITYFDTAPDYGPAEQYMGEAMNRIQRDRIIIASKFCSPYTYPSHLPLGSTKKEYIASVDGSLERLKTDYIDFCLVHAIGEQSDDREKEEKRLLDEEMLSAFETLKKSGKVRFLGVSSHGPNNMEHLLMTAVKSGNFDMIMPSFNFMKFPKLTEVLKEAGKNKVGVIAMKTLAGAKDSGLDRNDPKFSHSAFKWVLKHPEVNGLVITMKSVADLDDYLTASGEKFTAADQKNLDRYAKKFNQEYCRTGCSDCEPSCPEGVSIATTLRYQMYFKDYGDEKSAMKQYARLESKADSCLSCETEDCNGACPYGLPVSSILREAHDNLTFLA